MSNSNAAMLTAMENYLNKVSSTVSAGGKPLFHDSAIVLKPNVVKTYDIKTKLPTHALFDLTTATVSVLVLDTDEGSLTEGLYVNSEAVVVYGIGSNGIVKVYSASDKDVTAIIKITAPSIKL